MSPLFPLLGLLMRGERHGYELKQLVDRDYAPYWRIDYAQMYRSLSRLVSQGWADVRAEPGTRGPARKLYRVTSSGRKAFADWIRAPSAGREELLVKLRLAAELGMEASSLDANLARLRDERQERLDAFQAAKQAPDVAGLLFADAALRDIDAELANLDLGSALFANPRPPQTHDDAPLLISGSDDPLLARLAGEAHVGRDVVGSMAGLLALSKREADVAAIHLLDVETGEYNVPFVRHLLPEDDLVLVNLALRENGLMLAAGNPNKIGSVRDLARPDIRLVNRMRGTGTRLLLAARLRAEGIDPHSLPGWERAVGGHSAVAAVIRAGQADAGPGLRAVAEEWGLAFIPLGEERFDLVVEEGNFRSPRVESLMHRLHDRDFKRSGAELKGYDLARCGRIVARVR